LKIKQNKTFNDRYVFSIAGGTQHCGKITKGTFGGVVKFYTTLDQKRTP
jgi:hypothetical protein